MPRGVRGREHAPGTLRAPFRLSLLLSALETGPLRASVSSSVQWGIHDNSSAEHAAGGMWTDSDSGRSTFSGRALPAYSFTGGRWGGNEYLPFPSHGRRGKVVP